MERDHCTFSTQAVTWNFNSHAHVERDPTPALRHWGLLLFQLTRSRGAWRYACHKKLELSNFNSHAHVERDCNDLNHILVLFISTHTLTWSVTIYPNNSCYSDLISTHTLTWSVTSLYTLCGVFQSNFNSHAHVERDVDDLLPSRGI